MKKYLITAVAALSLGGLFTSCTRDTDFSSAEATQSITEKYEQIFVTAFGQPAPTQTWGFGENTVASTRAMTRAISVNGDSYDKFPSNDDVNSHFPESVPQGADELPTNGDYNYYFGNGAGHNYVISSAGTYTIGGGWQNTVYDAELNKGVPQPYNVYVSVEGDGEVIIKHSGSAMHNLYILKGNVKLDSSVGEMANVVITVAEGATLTDTREKLSARTELYGAIELYNKGTFYATNSTKYDMGNKARFYNSGKATITGPLTYSPADAENSFFMNFGDDAELTAPSMTLNSTGNFYNSGTTNITGETNVTQANIFWVNAGHYTTGTMTFSAKNTTFYNYCQLIVEDNCKFLDGEFNMMQNSYAEIGTGMFDNFIVNMYNNSGINIISGSKFERQAQGTFQGFRAVNDNAVVYVRLGGQTYVPSHVGAAFHVQGANLTLAYNSIKFYNSYNGDFGNYSNFNGPSYWDETTAEALIGNQDGRITWDLHNVTKLVTGDDFASTGFTTREGECAATWNGEPGGGEDNSDPNVVRVIAEDLTWGSENGDFDFNDVVFDVKLTNNNTQVQITLKAAGGTLPLYVAKHEVHDEYGVSRTTMVNTGRGVSISRDPSFTIENTYNSTDVNVVAGAIPVEVQKLVNGTSSLVELFAPKGKAAAKVAVGNDYVWCDERESIDERYVDDGKGKFSLFVRKEKPYDGEDAWKTWYK